MESFSYKVIKEIAKAINNSFIETFEVVPTIPKDQNTSPVLNGDGVLGLESWAVRYVLPYAHDIVIRTDANDDSTKYSSCLLVVNLLNPEMSTAWCRRKELVLQDKSTPEFELTLARLALSSLPKSNEAFAHRRWIFKRMGGETSNEELWDELQLTQTLADKYPSNYHAWCHRQWCLRNLGRKYNMTSYPMKMLPSNIPMPIEALVNLFNVSNVAILLKDMQCNLEFISRHVSDHSGMHHRSFLLQEIFTLLRGSSLLTHGKTVCGSDTMLPTNFNVEAIGFYNDLRQEIADFLHVCQDHSIKDYIVGLGDSLTLFDVTVSLILKDLRDNMTLSKRYEYHESLWCYRRFLVFKLCGYIAENRPFSEVLANSFLRQFALSEQAYLNHFVEKKGDLYDSRIVKNYYNWLLRVTKLSIVLNVQP